MSKIKIKNVSTIEATNAYINIRIDLPIKKAVVTIHYDCEHCGSHGCNECSRRGYFTKPLDLENIRTSLGEDTVDDLLAILDNLILPLMKLNMVKKYFDAIYVCFILFIIIATYIIYSK